MSSLTTLAVPAAAADTTPTSFTFTDVTGATISTVYESNTITVSGITSWVSVSITGGEYSKNGGSYTSVGGLAVNGTTFKVRHTSSGSNSTATNTVLTIGGVSDTYTTTTVAAVDTTPDAFTFTDIADATISTLYESNTITVAGVTSPATVTVTGGDYSKNGGAYTSTAGTASNGDTFKVRHTSSGSNGTATDTVLTIGGVSDTYTTTTEAAAGDWWDDPDYDDLAVVADFNEDRYALPTMSAEIITNGGFDTDTDWTKQTGWTISGGAAHKAAGVANNLIQTIPSSTSGKLYKLVFTISNIAGSGGVWANLGNAQVFPSPVTTNGTHTQYLVANGSYTSLQFGAQSTSAAMDIDNVSFKEVNLTASGGVYPKQSATFDEVFAYTAASTAARTYTDDTGVLRDMDYGLSNLLPSSATFTIDSQVTLTQSATTAPDATTTATKIVNTGVGGAHSFKAGNATTVVGVVYTFSMYAKAAEYGWFYAEVGPSVGRYVNLTTGALGGGSGALTVTDASNGWWRISFTAAATSTVHSVGGYLSPSDGGLSFTGTAGDGMYAWGPQIEPGSTLSDAKRGTSAVFNGVNARRMTYANAKRQLRLENAGTNLQPYSHTFSDANWTKENSITTSAAAPNGTSTAIELGGTGVFAMFFSGFSSSVHTCSIFAKAGSQGFATVCVGSGKHVTFNLTSGAVTQTTGTVAGSSMDYGNGWWRLVVTKTSAYAHDFFVVSFSSNGTPTTDAYGRESGLTGTGNLFWGAQTEVSAFVTDYIPSNPASTTRAIETCRLSPLVEAILQRAAASVVVRANGVADLTNFLGVTGTSQLFIRTAPTQLTMNGASGSLVATLGSGTMPTDVGMAMGFDAVGRSMVANGGTVVTDASQPAVHTQVYLSRNETSPNYGAAYHDFFAVSPERLSDATLQDLAEPA